MDWPFNVMDTESGMSSNPGLVCHNHRHVVVSPDFTLSSARQAGTMPKRLPPHPVGLLLRERIFLAA